MLGWIKKSYHPFIIFIIDNSMKIILRKDFETLGYAGDIKEVKEGYARNYLIPNGIAYIANKSNLKTFEEINRQQSRKTSKEIDAAKKIASKLEEEVVNISVKTGEEDKVFGSVTSQMIYDSLSGKGFDTIEKRKIILNDPIKTIGEHLVDIKLHKEVSAKLKVNVVKEDLQESSKESSKTTEEKSDSK